MENNQINSAAQESQTSGSAEQTGRSREEQKNRNFNLDEDTKDKIAQDTGIDKKDIADLQSLGAGSGRDDYAGGSGDGMSNVSTGEATDR